MKKNWKNVSESEFHSVSVSLSLLKGRCSKPLILADNKIE